MAQGLDRQGEVFTTQREERALREVEAGLEDTPGVKPLGSLESIYKSIQENA